MEALGTELKRYAKIRRELYVIKGFGGTSIDSAVSYAVQDMMNELERFATDKVAYLKSENEYLEQCLANRKAAA